MLKADLSEESLGYRIATIYASVVFGKTKYLDCVIAACALEEASR